MARFTLIVALLAVATTFISASPDSGEIVPLIIGGVEAGRVEFPWMVDIKQSSHTCGASIVNAHWVVTAAHCTQGGVSSYTVVAGDHDLNQDEGTEQIRRVERIVNHPEHSLFTKENDISLMKVSPPFELNDRVQPVALPAFGFLPTVNTTTAGWGRIAEGGSLSPQLLKVDVPYVDDDQCNQAYHDVGRIKESMICAGVLGLGTLGDC